VQLSGCNEDIAEVVLRQCDWDFQKVARAVCCAKRCSLLLQTPISMRTYATSLPEGALEQSDAALGDGGVAHEARAEQAHASGGAHHRWVRKQKYTRR